MSVNVILLISEINNIIFSLYNYIFLYYFNFLNICYSDTTRNNALVTIWTINKKILSSMTETSILILSQIKYMKLFLFTYKSRLFAQLR